MSVGGIRSVVEGAIQRAASATGVDFGFLMGTARRESSFNPKARAATSSASGLYQFIDQTWLSTLKKHGAKHGYARYAQLIEQGTDGRFRVSGSAEVRQAVMELKLDATAASLMAGELAGENASYLRGRVGRAPTSGELYVAHFLGPKGSAKLIEAVNTTPKATAAVLFPDAAAANRPLFYRAGRAVSVDELYANLTKTGGSAPASVREPDGEAQFVQYASARRLQRIETERAMVNLVLRGSQSPVEASPGALSRATFSADMLRVLSDARDEG